MSGNIPPAAVTVAVGTPAERLRTLLVAADSVTLLTPTHRADLTGRHRVGADGRHGPARPDPLAPAEAELLRRLDADPRTRKRLTGLVPARLRHQGARVHLLRLDRAGIVLRVQPPAGATAHPGDVRLPFARPPHDPGQLGARLDALLGRPPHSMSRTGR
ncbi:hypothetical protein [Micromonospora sp. ATCC 39149]|uniref:DUF2470 domain-containing protein n=1 Tax=Micromonospora carbonacea TaxID=47853 RepID=A0A7D6CGN9_9ACTN|nr:hypothetical protein [Micromonospora sp. ATCC 39149]QLK00993.1 hypothetical protein HZU44_13970 [Micromonospora carbonacea]